MNNKFENIRPGEKIVYHTGNLSRDVSGNRELSESRDHANEMFERGKAVLLQRVVKRHEDGSGVFEYIIQGVQEGAIKRLNNPHNAKFMNRVTRKFVNV